VEDDVEKGVKERVERGVERGWRSTRDWHRA
jgi:hypothetical protein